MIDKKILEKASKIVAGWPAWKRGILESSSKSTNSYSRLSVSERNKK